MVIHCARCGETRHTWSLWSGFRLAPKADVVCCLLPGFLTEPLAQEKERDNA